MCGFDRFDTTGQQGWGGQRVDEPDGARGRSWRGSGAWGLGHLGMGRGGAAVDLLLVVDFWKGLLTRGPSASQRRGHGPVALGAARAEVRCSRSDWSADGKLHMHEVDSM